MVNLPSKAALLPGRRGGLPQHQYNDSRFASLGKSLAHKVALRDAK